MENEIWNLKKGGSMDKRVITYKDCKLCDFVLICIVSKMFEAIPNCKEIVLDEKGCPASWKNLTRE
jgi:hypothetical protein